MTLGTWLSQAENVWRSQALLRTDGFSMLHVLRPRMYLVHWAMELYLKTLQMGLGLAPPATHDLVELYEGAVREAPELYREEWRGALERINPFNSSEFGGVRYPSPESYALDTADLDRCEGLIGAITTTVDLSRDVTSLAPRLGKILATREEELVNARKRVREGRAPALDAQHVYAYLEVGEQVQYWVDQASHVGWTPGPITNVEVLTRMAVEARITKFSELTGILNHAKGWGEPFLERVFENDEREWREVAGVDLSRPPTLDRQGPAVYLLIASYPELFTREELREKFGWGATTAVTDAAATVK